MELNATAIIAITGTTIAALIGIILAWAWKKIAGAASTTDLEKIQGAAEAAVKKIEDKAESEIQALEARIDLIGSRFMDQFQKFEGVFSARFEKFEAEIKTITRDGITSGVDARKEQWKEIRDQGERVASIEGYLTTQNGYKPRPRGG